MKKVLLIVGVVLLVSCSRERTLWDTDPEEVRAMLRSRDFSYVDEYAITEATIYDSFLLNPGDSYFLALRKGSNPLQQELLLQSALVSGSNPHREEAFVDLAELYRSREAWSKLFVLSVFPFPFFEPEEAEYYQYLALYRMESWSAFNTLAVDFYLHLPEKSRFEVLLFAVVAAFEVDPDRFQLLLGRFIHECDDDNLMYRLYLYLTYNSDSLEIIDPLSRARLYASAGEYGLAVRLYDSLYAEVGTLPESPQVLFSMGRSYAVDGDMSFINFTLLPFIEAGMYEKSFLYDVYWFLGRREREYGLYSAAAAYFKKAYAIAPAAEKERTLWYWLDSLEGADANAFLDKLDFLLSNWTDPAYFYDTLDDVTADLVREKRWNDLIDLYSILENTGDDYTLSRLSWILLLAEYYGYINVPPGLALSENLDLQGSNRFYTLISTMNVEHTLSEQFASLMYTLPTIAGEIDMMSSETNKSISLLLGYIHYQIPEKAFSLALAQAQFLDQTYLFDLAEQLSADSNYYEAFRLLNKGLKNRAPTDPLHALHLEYPLVYMAEIEQAVAGPGVLLPVMYGLVRQESSFNPLAGSGAGAAGLSQLMPGTAGDVASELGWVDYELTDPVSNLTFGAYYLAQALEKLDNYSEALMAYNAGPGRVRQWKRDFGDLPPLLFGEALPYRETRNYWRGVYVSAIIFNQLYGNKQALELTEQFFPGFSDIQLRNTNK